MKQVNTARILLSFGLVLLLSITSCKKEVKTELIQNDEYIRVLPEARSQKCWFVKSTKDKGYIIISSDERSTANDFESFSVTKLNKNGGLEWKNTYSDTIFIPRVQELVDGSLLITSLSRYSYILKLSSDGDLLFKNNFYNNINSIFTNSEAILGDDGLYYNGASDGGGTGRPSSNFLNIYDNITGQRINYFTISDAVFEGKIIYFAPYAVENVGNRTFFYTCGIKFEYPWSWSDYGKWFVTKIEVDNTNNSYVGRQNMVVNKDDRSNSFLDFGEGYPSKLVTPNKDLVLCTPARTPTGIDIIYVAKVDKSLNKKWDKYIKVGNGGASSNSITLCSDGNYLVCGQTIEGENKFSKPFAILISPNGDVIWRKTYPMKRAAYLFNGYLDTDGSYVFCGSTSSFGNGLDNADVFILKTDKDGNIK